MADFKTKKQLGQNFLKNLIPIKALVEALEISVDDVLVEIGPGLGAITNQIVDNYQFKNYFAYEIDNSLESYLEPLKSKNVTVVFENFLQARLSYIGDKYKIFGAIPYYITSPIIHKLLEQENRADKIALIIQKEVADKIIAQAPKASYWTYVTTGYDIEKTLLIQRDSFSPVPNVDSKLIVFKRNLESEAIIKEIGFYKWSKFLHLVYLNPRKMMNKAFPKEILEKSNIDPTLRPQNLSLEDILRIYHNLY